jgi:hypothetical protein
MPSTSVPPPAEALHRERVFDPDAFLLVLAWSVIALSCLQILLFSFGRDQSIYAVVAEGILAGKMPYRDVWDFKPPGIYFVYALAEAVFGKNMMAPRLLEVAGLLSMVIAFMTLTEKLFGMRRIGLVGGALAALIHAQLEFWHTGQPETFGGFLTAWALVLAVGFAGLARRRKVLAEIGIGLLFGCAFLLKPPLGGGALVVAAYLARAEMVQSGSRLRSLRPAALIAAGSLVPILAVALWFRMRGAWDAMAWTLLEFTPSYTQLGWGNRSAPEMFYFGLEQLFFRFSALAAAGLFAALVMRPMHGREREAILLLLGVISVHLAGIAMQGKFFQYHYAATLPLYALLAGIGLYKLWRRCLSGGAGGVLAFVSFVVVAAWMRTAVNDVGNFWERSVHRVGFALRQSRYESRELLDRDLYKVADYDLGANREVAHELRRVTPEDAPIFVWGFEPGIYWISGRRAASAYIYDVPQRVAWARERTRSELLRDLERSPPHAIVVQHRDRFSWVTGDTLDSAESLAGFAELAALIERGYELSVKIEDFDIYVRRGGA